MACSNCNQSAPNTKCGCQDQPITTGFNPTPNASCPDPTPCYETVDAQCVVYTGPTVAAVADGGSMQDFVLSTLKDITIPNLKVGTLYGDVYASLDFYTCQEWLNHNPRIFLFRTKGRKKADKDNNFKGRPSQFVHPTHLAKSGSKWFSGSASYHQFGGAPILRHTEFSIPNFTPYQRFNLNDVGLDKYEWVTYAEKGCEQIGIEYHTNYGNYSLSASVAGQINGKPYYDFTDPGSGQPFRIYYSLDANSWILQWTSDSYPNFSCYLPTQRDCPFDNRYYNKWFNQNSTGSGVTFYTFTLYNQSSYTTKRQCVATDLDQYNPDAIGRDGLASGYTGIYFNINLKNCNKADKKINFANQKIHFKLAIVIDNPNPTPDVPYLIGPMSDAFVLRFAQQSGSLGGICKFTNDYVSKILT